MLELTESFVGFTDTRFVVADMSSPYLSAATETTEAPSVQCTLFAYNPNTWDAPTENPTEPGFQLPSIRNLRRVGAPLSIEVSKVNSRATLDADGLLLANVVLKVGRSQ